MLDWLRRHYVRVVLPFAFASLASECPEDGERSYGAVRAVLPPDTKSASATIDVRVPEGDWTFQIASSGTLSLLDAQPVQSLTSILPPWEGVYCIIGSRCGDLGFRLHCPEGFCSFTFDAAAERGGGASVHLYAGISFLEDEDGEGDEGCNPPNSPEYVPPEERARLFHVAITPYDIVVEPADAGVSDAAVSPDANVSSFDGAVTSPDANVFVPLDGAIAIP